MPKLLKMLAAALTLALPGAANAQADWPSEPITVIIPFPAGGQAEIMTRLITDRMAPILGQPILVEAKPGAGGNIGTAEVVKSAPDGHTWLTSSVPLTTAPAMYPTSLEFDPLTDLEPVIRFGATSFVLAVPPAVPATTVAEFVDYARANDGQLSYAGSAVGSLVHLVSELFNLEAGIDVQMIPYNGQPPAIADLLANRVQYMVIGISLAKPLIDEGKLTALAVFDEQRSKALPDVPTISEAGYPSLTANSWAGFHVPAGTPDAIIDKINATVAQVLSDPALGEQVEKAGWQTVAPQNSGRVRRLRRERDRPLERGGRGREGRDQLDRLDDHHGRRRHAGVSGWRRPAAFRSDHRFAGTGVARDATLRATSSGETIPVATLATTGCRRGKWSAAVASGTRVIGADRGDPAGAVENLGRRIGVEELGPLLRTGREDARVEGSGGDDRDTARRASREEPVETALVEEGVAAGEHEDVEVTRLGKAGEHRGIVHADADRADEAGVAKPGERAVAALHHLAEARLDGIAMPVAVDVVDVEDVDAVGAETLEAVLDRAEHPVPRIVVDRLEGERVAEHARRRAAPHRPQHPSDLRRDHRAVPDTAKAGTEPVLGEAVAIEGCRIEIGDPRREGSRHGRVGHILLDDVIEPAERAAAETEDRHLDLRPTKRPPFHRLPVDQISPHASRSACAIPPYMIKTPCQRSGSEERHAAEHPGFHARPAAAGLGWSRKPGRSTHPARR